MLELTRTQLMSMCRNIYTSWKHDQLHVCQHTGMDIHMESSFRDPFWCGRTYIFRLLFTGMLLVDTMLATATTYMLTLSLDFCMYAGKVNNEQYIFDKNYVHVYIPNA